MISFFIGLIGGPMHRNMIVVHQPVSPEGDQSKRKCLKIPTALPILFLAGPIRNAPPWHSQAIRIALKQNWQGFIASPAHQIDADLLGLIESDKPEYGTFPRQRAWEQYYMYSAAENGCIMFWLCKEAAVKQFTNKVYAHITMLELGKWIERKKLLPKTRLVIGTDGEFPELSTIEFEIGIELPGFIIHRSLEETVEAGIKTSLNTKG
jgi:hypothetical protein